MKNDNNISRNAYVWNFLGSMLQAFQSVIILMVLTRVLGVAQAGIFTIAYANANLFLNIGKYGMRNYQVSDINEQYSFKTYRVSRYITTFLMIVVGIIYTIYNAEHNDYTNNKTWILIWMCLFRSVDALEDIFWGRYQQKGRLDIGAKALTIRTIVSIIVFLGMILLTRNHMLSLCVATIVNFFVMLLLILFTYKVFVDDVKSQVVLSDVIGLLKQCLPLFFGAFLSFYICNAPKYAIDAQLSDELQAYFGFIAMPVFVIGLMNNFIFSPIIKKMSELWNNNNIDFFIRRMKMQILIIIVITMVCIIGAYFIGIPVLSILYSTDLSAYRKELIIMLLGGGLLAFAGFLNTILVIIRYQECIVIGYGISSLFALMFSNIIVKEYGVTGASWLYTILMAIVCVLFSIMFYMGVKKKNGESSI